MARNSGKSSEVPFGNATKPPKSTDTRSNVRHWLSPHLNEYDQVWLRDNSDDIPRFVFGVLAELPVGYTLSSKFDDRTDRWLATLICDRVDDPNRGIAVTGRGSTRINSVYTCIYIAAVKLEWSWAEATTQGMGDYG
ncbi:MAG TPA: hypothetical protein VFM05_15245, partial [Candidatus Saccharimonadales bacterium]|nr:hypothetical protein [Candidatus Saccharimonadales bacterium]